MTKEMQRRVPQADIYNAKFAGMVSSITRKKMSTNG